MQMRTTDWLKRAGYLVATGLVSGGGMATLATLGESGASPAGAATIQCTSLPNGGTEVSACEQYSSPNSRTIRFRPGVDAITGIQGAYGWDENGVLQWDAGFHSGGYHWDPNLRSVSVFYNT